MIAKKKRVIAIVSTNELPEEELKKVLLEELKRQYEIKYGKFGGQLFRDKKNL